MTTPRACPVCRSTQLTESAPAAGHSLPLDEPVVESFRCEQGHSFFISVQPLVTPAAPLPRKIR